MPPHPPDARRTDRRAVTAFVLSIVGLLLMLSAGRRNGEYVGEVARGVGANLPGLVVALVALALAAGAVRRAAGRARAGRGQGQKGLPVAATVLAGLTVIGCVLHVVGLIVATSG
jgi:hypothetical protein